MTQIGKKRAFSKDPTLFRPVSAGLFSALIAVCSWVQIPFQIPFTMQTFAVFSALLFLGGKYGTLSIVVYVFLGLAGLPVFSGFKGGAGVLFGATGGYISGFVIGALAYWSLSVLFERKGRFNIPERIFSLSVCLFICYFFGTLWFTAVHGNVFGFFAFISSFSVCVLPFIVPDALKMAISVLLYLRLKPLLIKMKITS